MTLVIENTVFEKLVPVLKRLHDESLAASGRMENGLCVSDTDAGLRIGAELRDAVLDFLSTKVAPDDGARALRDLSTLPPNDCFIGATYLRGLALTSNRVWEAQREQGLQSEVGVDPRLLEVRGVAIVRFAQTILALTNNPGL